MDAIVDGTLTLKQTLSAIQFKEAGGWGLIALAPGADAVVKHKKEVPVNYASFERVRGVPKALDLVTIGTGKAAVELISQKWEAGWKLVVYCKIYVSGTLEQVAAFRKV